MEAALVKILTLCEMIFKLYVNWCPCLSKCLILNNEDVSYGTLLLRLNHHREYFKNCTPPDCGLRVS